MTFEIRNVREGYLVTDYERGEYEFETLEAALEFLRNKFTEMKDEPKRD